MKHLLPPMIIFVLILGVFYFDRFSIIGADVSYYFDISYLISSGQNFLIDFFDYRIPVFPFLFSVVYKFGHSDFINRFIASVFLYSMYSFVIYFISLFITKSEKKSAFVAILTLLSISSRQLDPGREMEVPLFYHTLEIISAFILLKTIMASQNNNDFRLKHFSSLMISGALFGLAFIGRPVHVLPPILLLGYLFFDVYKNGLNHFGKQALRLVLPFLIGFTAIAYLIFKSFYVSGSDFINQARIWLLEVPRLFYLGSHPVLNILRKIAATLHTGLAELRNINLPIFWLVYVFAIQYFYKNFMTDGNPIKTSLINIYNKHKDAVWLIFVALTMTITTTMTTGFGGTNHQAPFFTLYALLLAFLLSQTSIKKLSTGTLIFMILFILPNFYRFIREEKVLYQKSYSQRKAALLPDKIAEALAQTGVKKNDTVLILGAYPNVTRLVGYKPFLGLINDVFLYSLPRIYGPQYEDAVYKKLQEVPAVYKLLDYPNLEWAKENENNPIYKYIENYLKTDFKVVAVVKNEYANGEKSPEVIIYKRVEKVKR